jgi:hypothetical protein
MTKGLTKIAIIVVLFISFSATLKSDEKPIIFIEYLIKNKDNIDPIEAIWTFKIISKTKMINRKGSFDNSSSIVLDATKENSYAAIRVSKNLFALHYAFEFDEAWFYNPDLKLDMYISKSSPGNYQFRNVVFNGDKLPFTFKGDFNTLFGDYQLSREEIRQAYLKAGYSNTQATNRSKKDSHRLVTAGKNIWPKMTPQEIKEWLKK